MLHHLEDKIILVYTYMMTLSTSTTRQDTIQKATTPLCRPHDATQTRLSYSGDVKFIIGNRMEATIHSNGSMSYRFIR